MQQCYAAIHELRASTLIGCGQHETWAEMSLSSLSQPVTQSHLVQNVPHLTSDKISILVRIFSLSSFPFAGAFNHHDYYTDAHDAHHHVQEDVELVDIPQSFQEHHLQRVDREQGTGRCGMCPFKGKEGLSITGNAHESCSGTAKRGPCCEPSVFSP